MSESLIEMNVLLDIDNKVSVNVLFECVFLKIFNDKILVIVVLNVVYKINVDIEFLLF